MSSVSRLKDIRINSDQRAWQLMKQELGLCVICGREPLAKGSKSRCKGCRERDRVRIRAKKGLNPWKKGGRGRPPSRD